MQNALYAFSNVPKKIQTWDLTQATIPMILLIFLEQVFSFPKQTTTQPTRVQAVHGVKLVPTQTQSTMPTVWEHPSWKITLLFWPPQSTYVPESDRAFAGGLNSGLYPIRNDGGSSAYDQIDFRRNVVLGVTETTYYPIASSSGGQPNWTKPLFENNVIEAGRNGAYFYPNPEIVWLQNYDADTFDLIAPNPNPTEL